MSVIRRFGQAVRAFGAALRIFWHVLTDTDDTDEYEPPTPTLTTYRTALGKAHGPIINEQHHLAIDGQTVAVIHATEMIADRLADLVATHGLLNPDDIIDDARENL